MNIMHPASVEASGRSYPWPKVPAVVICLDGCEPAYLDEAIAAGCMPALERVKANGTSRIAHGAMPSFTNPNNLSIATGRPPAVHGICGNYLYEPETEQEVMMNDPRFLRAPTIFAAFQRSVAKVAIVTAKDKLRALLGHGLDCAGGRAVCFSAERASAATEAEHGIENASRWLGRPAPEVYSAELSEFVLDAGVRLLAEFRPDVMYLSTTDYVQHKLAPGSKGANEFHAKVDRYIGELDKAGAVVVLTADHGMKPKHLADGSPAVVYLQDLLNDWLGREAARVILPITDPYVVHHGALGSFATVYLPQGTDVAGMARRLAAVEGMQAVLTRDEAVRQFELPGDRIGDVVLVSTENMTIGTSADRHDLSGLTEPLRSHGGLTEQSVPFIVNRAMPDMPHAPELRNYDAFFYATTAAAI